MEAGSAGRERKPARNTRTKLERAARDFVRRGGDFTRQIVHAVGTTLPPEQLLTTVPLDAAIEGLAGPEDYPALVAELRGRGRNGERLAGILGGNLLRLLRRALPE